MSSDQKVMVRMFDGQQVKLKIRASCLNQLTELNATQTVAMV